MPPALSHKIFLFSFQPFIVLFFLFAFSCKKDEVIHEYLIVDGNTAPPVDGVSGVQLNNYVNRLYIDLLGRAPTADELTEGANTIKDDNYSDAAREELITSLMSAYEYYKNINILTGQKMLVDADSLTILGEIYLYQVILAQAILNGDSLAAFVIEYELDKLVNLQNAGIDLYNELIGVDEYYRRYIYNIIYDEVNMGSENFVISCFQNLFHRNPTEDEKFDGIAMVDGVSSQLFLVDGSSKEDFIDIIVHSLEFSQGIVIEICNSFLARDPDSEEMNAYALEISNANHFNPVKIKILKSEEYAGF